jgi:uncharacterized phiE125 gp8 family phage protein
VSWIGYAYGLVTATTLGEPMTVEEAKLARRIQHDDEDANVERWIRSARAQVESHLGRGLLTQTWKLALDAFADEMVLPMAAPLQSVTHVKYYNTSGTLTTLSSSVYQVDTLSEPGRVLLAPDQTWPDLQSGRLLAVEITYVVGWTSVDQIPAPIVDAMHLLIGDRDAHREDTLVGSATRLPRGVDALLGPHRVWWREPKSC